MTKFTTNFKIPTLKGIADYFAEKINNIFFQKDASKGDTKELLSNASDLVISFTPAAKVDYFAKTANRVLDNCSQDPLDSYSLHPFKREQEIGESLGYASKNLSSSLQGTLASRNPRIVFDNIANLIDNSQQAITKVATAAQTVIGDINHTDKIDLSGTKYQPSLQKAQEAKKTINEGVVGLVTSVGLKPLYHACKLIASAIEVAEKPPEINSLDKMAKESEQFSKQLANDSRAIFGDNIGNVGNLVGYFQSLINANSKGKGYNR